MEILINGKVPSTCELRGCDRPAVATLIAHPLKRHAVGGCSSVCADHLEKACAMVARAFLISNKLLEPADDRERDYLAVLEEHIA
jgi:hypothetical protein